jgi:hypothetical protein
MLDATWIAAVATSAVVLLSLVGMWTRVNARVAAITAELAAVRSTLGRIEDAIWAQAGVAVLRGDDRPRHQSPG